VHVHAQAFVYTCPELFIFRLFMNVVYIYITIYHTYTLHLFWLYIILYLYLVVLASFVWRVQVVPWMAPAALRRPCRSDPKAKSTESGLRARPMGTLGIHGNLGGIPFGYSTVRHGIDGP
jgi:hypothetical protein